MQPTADRIELFGIGDGGSNGCCRDYAETGDRREP